MHILKKMSQKVLNRVLTLPKARARRELSIGVIYVTRASICVELRPFYCRKIILVPMSYIICVEIAVVVEIDAQNKTQFSVKRYLEVRLFLIAPVVANSCV